MDEYEPNECMHASTQAENIGPLNRSLEFATPVQGRRITDVTSSSQLIKHRKALNDDKIHSFRMSDGLTGRVEICLYIGKRRTYIYGCKGASEDNTDMRQPLVPSDNGTSWYHQQFMEALRLQL